MHSHAERGIDQRYDFQSQPIVIEGIFLTERHCGHGSGAGAEVNRTFGPNFILLP